MKDENNSIFPLRGVKILDLTRLIQGAFCTSTLGGVGAEVVKVEEIEVGDYGKPFHTPRHSLGKWFWKLTTRKQAESCTFYLR